MRSIPSVRKFLLQVTGITEMYGVTLNLHGYDFVSAERGRLRLSFNFPPNSSPIHFPTHLPMSGGGGGGGGGNNCPPPIM